MTDLGEPLAIGRTAEIYPWPDGKVLKLSLSSIPLSWVDGETALSDPTGQAGAASGPIARSLTAEDAKRGKSG